MNTLDVAFIIRILQFVPLVLVLLPLFRSYWIRRNILNGLRPTRIFLIILFSCLVLNNTYFVIFQILDLKRSVPSNQLFVLLDKIVSLVSYVALYWLFKHASMHGKKK